MQVDEKDYGEEPFVTNIEDATEANTKFRVAKWTGKNMQLTLMSVEVGSEIGLELHRDIEQFLRVESGRARVEIGPEKDQLDFVQEVGDDEVILIPSNTWHNIINIGDKPLKVYSIYAGVDHPKGTVHATKAEADEAENEHNESA